MSKCVNAVMMIYLPIPVLHLPQFRQEMIFNEAYSSNMHGGRKDIITTLRSIDMIISMNRIFTSHYSTSNLNCSIANDLIS